MTKRTKENKQSAMFSYLPYALLAFLVLVHAGFLLFRLNVTPDIFLDEANGMYDSWCLANYGTDSNLIHNPVYLQGFTGQGQSVLYALLAGPFMKILGYSLFAYRLPLAICSTLHVCLLGLTLLHTEKAEKALWMTLAVGTAPYLLCAARFGMDCNISPFLCSSGSVLLCLGCGLHGKPGRWAALLCGISLLGMTAYSYNVSWLFLPVYLSVLAVCLCRRGMVRRSEMAVMSLLLLLIICPVVIFAIRSNYPAWNRTVEILWWTSPALPAGRAGESVISLADTPVRNVVMNLYAGWKMFANGTDGLSWNSVGTFGPCYRFALPFFLIGLWTVIRRREKSDIFILAQLIAMIPICLLVKPNYNHWMFLHIPMLLTTGTGISETAAHLREAGWRRVFTVSLLITYLCSFAWYVFQYHRGERYTGWESSGMELFDSLHTEDYETVYFITDQRMFLYNVRVCKPVPPREFQATKDHPWSETEFWMDQTYANFVRIHDDMALDDGGSLYLIQDSHINEVEDRLKGKTELDDIQYNGITYKVFEDVPSTPEKGSEREN